MRLIDADAQLKEYCADCPIDIRDICAADPMCGSARWLAGVPTVDAVPVVRCKDCKHCEDRKKYLRCVKRGFSAGHEVMPDDFCSYGERCE